MAELEKSITAEIVEDEPSASVSDADSVSASADDVSVSATASDTDTLSATATSTDNLTASTAEIVRVSGEVGETDHSALLNLSYERSGHTGFQKEITSSNKLSYSLLSDTPTIPTKTSQLSNDSGYVTTQTLGAHVSDTSNPHSVTKAQVGLGNVDNTSDMNKPVSNATNVALNTKVDKKDGYSLVADSSVLSYDTHLSDTNNPHSVTKAQVGLGKVINAAMDLSVTEDSTNYISSGAVKKYHDPSKYDATNPAGYVTSDYHDATKYDKSNPAGYVTESYHDSTKYDASNPSGYVTASYHDSTKYDASNPAGYITKASLTNYATLVDGKVPESQLPSYVDDVLEYDSKEDFPEEGESGKIYVAKDKNITYRWGGSAYVEISSSLALGETASTAYRGDRGKTAYDHSQLTSGNPHNVTKTDIGLEKVENTADLDKPISTATQTALDGKQPKLTSGSNISIKDNVISATDTITTATTTGNGNAVTSITATNGALTVTKGATFLTEHQSLAGYATEQWVTDKGYTTNTGTVTSVTVTGSNGLSGTGTITTSGTVTLSNSGVRSITQNASDGHKLTINTGGTDATITIPDNNTWRGIQNNLTSTSTTDSLSAYQGKLLNDNKLESFTSGGLASCSGNGQYNYYTLATIKITGGYINRPVVFEMSGRGRMFSQIQVLFQNTSSTDPGLTLFITNYENGYYIKKTDTSTWVIYASYSESWGSSVCHRITGEGASIGVTLNMTNISELPSGTTQVSYGGYVRYATSAGSAGSATNDSSGNKITDTYLPLSGGTMTGALLMPSTATYSETSQPMALSYGRLQCYGTLNINANTDNSGTEYVILTAGHGCSSSTSDGLAIGTNTLTWKDSAVALKSDIPSSLPANGGTSSYANIVYCTSHPGTWYINSQWNDTYFITNAAYNGSTLPIWVNNAGYADSAGSVAWGNVSDRPANMSTVFNGSGTYTFSTAGIYVVTGYYCQVCGYSINYSAGAIVIYGGYSYAYVIRMGSTSIVSSDTLTATCSNTMVINRLI